MPRFPAAHIRLTEAIEQHAFPGAAYGVLLRGEVLAIDAAGHFSYAPEAPPVFPETIFDMASLTKVLATTAMAMLLWQRGQLDLDQPVGEHLPAFLHAEPPHSDRRRVTARMLLAHSSGLPAYARLFEGCPTPQTLLDACLRMPLASSPGTRTIYSDIGFIVLGHLLETLAAKPLDPYCRREIFLPLGMNATHFRPAPELRPAIPPTAIDDSFRHRLIQGEVHDENCFVLGGVSGHAGLFSNVPDTLRFARAIVHPSPSIFAAETISLFTARTVNLDGPGRALGWDVPTAASSSGKFFSSHSVGHLGFTGTSLWLDLDRELAVVLLSNRTFPGHDPGGISNRIQQVRPRFHDALLGDLGYDAPAG